MCPDVGITYQTSVLLTFLSLPLYFLLFFPIFLPTVLYVFFPWRMQASCRTVLEVWSGLQTLSKARMGPTIVHAILKNHRTGSTGSFQKLCQLPLAQSCQQQPLCCPVCDLGPSTMVLLAVTHIHACPQSVHVLCFPLWIHGTSYFRVPLRLVLLPRQEHQLTYQRQGIVLTVVTFSVMMMVMMHLHS